MTIKGKPREGHGANIIPEEPIKSGIRILPAHLLKKVYSLLFLIKVKSLKLVDSASIFAALGTIKRLYWARIGSLLILSNSERERKREINSEREKKKKRIILSNSEMEKKK